MSVKYYALLFFILLSLQPLFSSSYSTDLAIELKLIQLEQNSKKRQQIIVDLRNYIDKLELNLSNQEALLTSLQDSVYQMNSSILILENSLESERRKNKALIYALYVAGGIIAIEAIRLGITHLIE